MPSSSTCASAPTRWPRGSVISRPTSRKKDKLRVMIEKSDSDDLLVQALRAELEKRKGGGGGGGGRAGGGQPAMSEAARGRGGGAPGPAAVAD